MILFLFFCSGATALVYEVVWSKYLSLMFGSTVYAQTVVLAVFMGGLALGNRLIGHRSDLLAKPLAGYGKLELVIGFYAFAFSWIYQLFDHLFVTIGARMLEFPAGLLVLKGVLSVGLLILPTVMMGGTLPLLAAWLRKHSEDAGRWSARFYSINSLGAVAGACLAGFYLIHGLGLVSTLQMTALVNVIIGFIAVGLGRQEMAQMERPSPAVSDAERGTSQSPVLRWVIILVALTGGVSMGLEVLASRSLTLIFGASVQAFAIVLMSFILGIGLGSAVIASPRLKAWRSENVIFILLLGAGAVVGLLVLGIEQWVEIYRHVLTGIGRSAMGYRFYQIIAAAFSLVILGIPAGLIGAVLPLCIRLIAGSGKDFGNRVGRLLTWNTLGAVAGVLLTGFVLMPNVGVRNAFNVLAMVLCVPVLLLAWRMARPLFLVSGALLIAGLVVSSVFGGTGWRYVLSSGVFRSRESFVDPHALEERKKHIKILFYEDGPDATVSVEQGDGIAVSSEMGLRISGKPEASTRSDLSTQLLVSHLPMLMRPESKDVFLLGLASGISARAFLAYPVEHLHVAENCAPVLRAVDLFAPWNRGVVTNPVTRIWLEDARTVLKLNPQTYDVIVSEPSNPWFASIGSIFSREFYQLASSRLKPGGLMVQWFHVYEMHDGIVELVLRTFSSVFPVFEIWDASGGDLLLIGSHQQWDSSLSTFRPSFSRELVREDLSSIGFATPEALLARQFASQRTAFAIPGPGPVQSDLFPILEYQAPMAFFVGITASKIARFDERTWQAPFASAEKRAVLKDLNDDSLQAAFEAPSINLELRQAIKTRLQGTMSGPQTVLTLPTLFQRGSVNEEWFPPKTSEPLKELLRACARLQREEGDWKSSVQTIRTNLLNEISTVGGKPLEKSHVGFATVAARACIANRQFDAAKELLGLGAQFAPSEPELAFLARLLEREARNQSL